MLKALGAPGRSLRAIFIGEALVTTLAAAVAGIMAGAILGYAFELSQRFAQEAVLLPAFDFTTAIVIVVIVCLAAIFSAALATQPVIRQKAIKILRER
jgi:ABC-type antimicrobial peptide transport system permease subunit